MSIRGKVAVLAAAALVAGALTALPARAATDTVVATVNGEKIFKKDVLEAVEALKPMMGDKVSLKDAFPMVLEQIINEKLLDDAARDAKVEKTGEYKKRLEVAKAQIVKQIYFEKFLAAKVTDDRIKAAYNDFKKKNKGKMEVHARHILVPTEVEAKQVIKDLAGGAKFEDLAMRRSSGPSAAKGGDVGYFVKEEMLGPFADAAFKLKPGSYSKEPVQTDFGWHVIKVEDKRERQVPDYNLVSGAIREQLAKMELQNLVGTLREKAAVEVYGMDGKKNEPAEKKAESSPSTGDAAKKLEAKEAAQKKD